MKRQERRLVKYSGMLSQVRARDDLVVAVSMPCHHSMKHQVAHLMVLFRPSQANRFHLQRQSKLDANVFESVAKMPRLLVRLPCVWMLRASGATQTEQTRTYRNTLQLVSRRMAATAQLLLPGVFLESCMRMFTPLCCQSLTYSTVNC